MALCLFLDLSIAETGAGYKPDHLNRSCRAATGLTLREHRDEQVLARARAEVRRSRSVAEAYAGRFRKHTGRQPREILGG